MPVEPAATALQILIVDDSSHFLDAARRALERDGRIVVSTASTSAEALRLAAETAPDAILVDVDLGDESGLDLAQQLATADRARVVLISAYPESELTDLIAASPAVGFVAKSELSSLAITNLLGEARDRG